MDGPRFELATNAQGLNISYISLGAPGRDILWVPNFTGRVDALMMDPTAARFLREVASIGRLTSFDSVGTGGSDPIPPDQLPTMEQWMDDVRVVMDAEGIDRATLFAMDSGGPVAALFAATHPDRCEGLILVSSFARLARAPGYEIGVQEDRITDGVDRWMSIWRTGAQVRFTAPSMADDRGFREYTAFLERATAPPRLVRPIFEMISRLDVRDVLPAIRVPTLVLHRAGDRWIGIEHGRYLAQSIPGARFVELPGEDHYPFIGDIAPVVEEVRAFVTGDRRATQVDERALATLLFTDIVDSTACAADVGDARWRDLLDRHDEAVRAAIERFRGREIKTTGDGFFATFDGPARAVRCAAEIASAARALGVEVRAGLHCGEVEVRGTDVSGLSVNLASRVAAMAEAGQVLVSQTVKDLTIGSGLEFEDHGSHELKGVPGEWRIYRLTR